MSRPDYQRTSSTNLLSSSGARPLEGKVAIITGGSRGIGAAVARNLASKGCHVVLNYTSDSSSSKADAVASEIHSAHNVTALPIQADMGDPAGPAHLVTLTKNHFSHPKTGKFQVDIIVNNAGVAGNELIQDSTIEAFQKQYAINVLGPLLLVQAAMPYLPHDRSGRIVNVSSVSSSVGFPGQSIYGGTKAALESMTRTWARELSERCTVNAINPGPVATDMYAGIPGTPFEASNRPFVENTPLAKVRPEIDGEELVKYAEKAGGRPAYDHEVAGIVGMLCTADGAWCTGLLARQALLSVYKI
ncbi:hypothetical protein MMC11_008481 [Xylographa trunciseda]|nr:hypothetical protein [Xylographa trunciseda]